MDEPSPVRYGRIGDVMWIRVEGKGTFENSGGLSRYVTHLEVEGKMPGVLVIDLEECPVMDSTFMGALAGLALGVMEGKVVEVLNANVRNRQLLRNLGLDHILVVKDDEGHRAEERRMVAAGVAMERFSEVMGQKEKAEHILEAHRSLGEANPENIPLFRDVVKYFEEDLDKLKGEGEGAGAPGGKT